MRSRPPCGRSRGLCGILASWRTGLSAGKAVRLRSAACTPVWAWSKRCSRSPKGPNFARDRQRMSSITSEAQTRERSGYRLPAWRRRVIGAVALCGILPVAVHGQDIRPSDTLHVEKTLFDGRDALLAGGFAVVTIAMFPVDRSIALRLQDSSTQANHFLKHASVDLQDLADPGAAIIGVSLYGIGRISGWKDMADLGLHGTEAVALSGAITDVLKGVAGRARPYVSDSTPDHFKFGRGFGNGAYQSFPSGHATAAFAAASVMTSEAWRWWPQGIWLVAPAMYGGATLVGLSRMYNNDHWASDVVLGAAIGTFSGLKVVRYNHAHPHNLIDRALLEAMVMSPPAGGVGLGWSVTP
jgi:membrane-associated phospholipid phosphatase